MWFGVCFFFSLENITVAGEEGEGDMNEESSMEAYTLIICKIDSQWKFSV